jgi:uncharacterized protein (DUF433 family)
MATETLSAAEKRRLVPGISSGTEPAGRYAKITGTGIDVWQMIDAYKREQCDRSALAEAFPWLSEDQIDAALRYYALFPEEIDARIALEELYTPE